jgi:DHA1 family tetracycline resistance protein-like MFS transporter
MGKLSDQFGRRPLLIVSQLSTFLSFIVLGFANSLWMIILSRVIDGLFGSNRTIAQAYLSDISSKKDRSKAFGLSGMAFGIGFLVGPATGGFLSQFGYDFPAFVAAGISLITVVTTLLFLPETVKSKKSTGFTVNILNSEDFVKYFSNKKIAFLLISFATYVFALFTFTSNLSLFSERKLSFGATEVGYLLAYVGVINLVLRSPLLGKIIDLIGERILMYFGIFLMVLGLLGISLIQERVTFFIVFTLFAIGSAFSRPLISGEISRNVSDKEQGAINGVLGSLGSIARIIGPILGGYLLDNHSPGSLPLMAATIIGLGLIFAVWGCVRGNNGKKGC